MATGVDYMYEQRWGFLRPWTHVLRGQFGNYLCRLQSSPFDPTRLYVPVMAFNRSVMTQEGLNLLAAVAHVNYSAWKYLLINHCEVKLGQPWEEDVEGEIVVRFHLTMYRNDRNVQDLVRMCGIHQHDRPSREYLEALARIAAIDNNSHTKSRGVEIPVPIVVLFRNKTDSQRNLDDVLRHRDVGEIIQREWDERALPDVEAGAFRCTFVLGSAKANLSHYQNRVNLDMAEKMEELVHANVWFSHVSLDFKDGFKTFEGGTRLRREIVARLVTSLFDSTRRSYESPTNYLKADNHAPIPSHQVDKISLSKWCQNDCEAFCSAAALGQTVRELTLSSIRSMTTSEIGAFCAILASQHPEVVLIGCPSGLTGVQDATLVANSPIRWDFDEQNQPVLSSDVLRVAGPISSLRILSESDDSEWVNALVPGYGRCQVQRKNIVFSAQVDIVPDKSWVLEIRFIYGEIVDISGLPVFFAAVGTFLKTLSIDTGEVSVDVNMVLDRLIDSRAAGSPVPAITFSFNEILAFTKELTDSESALSNCLQRLTIHQCNRPNDPNWRTTTDFVDTLLKMLDSNERLEYLRVGLATPSRDYVKWFKRFHLQPINRSVRLDP